MLGGGGVVSGGFKGPRAQIKNQKGPKPQDLNRTIEEPETIAGQYADSDRLSMLQGQNADSDRLVLMNTNKMSTCSTHHRSITGSRN